MNPRIKKIIIICGIVSALAAACYGAYRAYHFLIEDATLRIQKGVSLRIKRRLLNLLNPFAWGRKSE